MNKPRVDCLFHQFFGVGRAAIVSPYNHPNHIDGHQISNNLPVFTSKVVSYDVDDNSFETLNTVYVGVSDGPRLSSFMDFTLIFGESDERT